MAWDADHLPRLEVGEDQDPLALEVGEVILAPEAGADEPGRLLADVDLLAEKLVGILVLPGLCDGADSDVELADVDVSRGLRRTRRAGALGVSHL